MARHGENIRKRTDGRWEGRYKVFDQNKGKHIYRSVYGNTYDEVKEKQSNARLDLANTAAAEHTVILFSQAASEWLADIAGKRKYSTYVKYETIYRNHLSNLIGSCRFSDAVTSKIQSKIFDYLSEASLSQSLQRDIYNMVNQILVFANRKYLFDISLLKIPDIKLKAKPVRTFSRAEQARLLSVIYDQRDSFRIALLLCLYTGLRLGELCALKWSDFDFRSMSLTVSRTVQRIASQSGVTKTTLLETAPKTEDSRRTIPLTPEIAELLAQLRESQPYVFGAGKPLEPRTMQYRFKKLLKEAGIEDRNFHVLRHTFATNCVENGMDVKALSEILGHSDVKITLNRYVHPTMESKRKQICLLPEFYGQILGHVS